MEPIALCEIADICQGQLLGEAPSATVNSVSTDTRTLQPGELFVALKGEKHDGHDFVQQALDRGAVAVVVSSANDIAGPHILVDDTLEAYGRLGAWARRQSDATFIAVTGSAGKTTTKDMLGQIVKLVGPSLIAPATENNEIGVPRLLLQLQEQHEWCVLELAMRGQGEIAYLTDICAPQIGVITNIGQAHIGRLGGREAIAQAKGEMLPKLPEDGAAVLNSEDFFFNLHRHMTSCPIYSFGITDVPEEVAAHTTAENIKARGVEPARFDLLVEDQSMAIQLRVPGEHNVRNALAAAAAATAAGIPANAVKLGLEQFSGASMRSQVLSGPNGSIIINDAYNASPTSTPEALKLLGQSGQRRIFVFGNMLELGNESEHAHHEIGKLAVEYGVDWMITVGQNAMLAAAEAEAAGLQVNAVQEPSEASALLKDILGQGDVVLVKASRAMGLETIIEDLLENG